MALRSRGTGTFQVAQILGIPIRINPSWFFIFLLVLWSYSQNQFPSTYPLQNTWAYWLMGLVTTIFLFLSLLLHELCHSLVAQRFAIPIESITLFILGGVSQMREEPKSPAAEFWMAVAGPAASIGLAILAAGLVRLFEWVDLPWMWIGVARQILFLNLVVAIFNLTPGFPLDGGRIVRSFLWGITRNLRRSTKIAATIGKGISFLFIALSLAALLLGGSLLSSIWMIFIAAFLYEAATNSYRQILIQTRLDEISPEIAPHLATPRPEQIVPAGITLQSALEIMTSNQVEDLYVMEEGQLVGVLHRGEILRKLEEN